jgi:integrase/recombinase XerD
MSNRGKHRRWPTATLSCKPLDLWPPPDRAAWANATTVGSVLDPGGWASDWASATLRKTVSDYGRWLAWLETQGELDPSLTPGARATRERVAGYLNDQKSRLSSFSVQANLQGLGDALRVMTETQVFGWVTRGAARLRTHATSTKKKRQKLKPSDKLVDLGLNLMDEADCLSEADMPAAALQFRNGLIIALLAYCPLRAKNLAAITLGQHLAKRGGMWWLIFPAEETKQRRPLETPFPASLGAALERYLAEYRPALTAKGAHRGSAGNALWISQDGGALTTFGISQAICRLTKAAFGSHINQHLFRDCAATMIAIDDPDHVHIIPAILGHSSMATSERHYNQARSLEAGRRYHATLGAVRANKRRAV